ncbi:hypothetical protein GC207_12780 [bacterium]|nr:hypothetical protein [bacterium]
MNLTKPKLIFLSLLGGALVGWGISQVFESARRADRQLALYRAMARSANLAGSPQVQQLKQLEADQPVPGRWSVMGFTVTAAGGLILVSWSGSQLRRNRSAG